MNPKILIIILTFMIVANAFSSDDALVLFYNKDFEKAELQFLSEIDSKKTDKVLGYYYLGLIRYLNNDHDGAMAYWKKGKKSSRKFFDGKIYKMPSTGMEPTLKRGDFFLVDIEYYKYNKPQKNDLVLFVSPQDNKTIYVKRIAGVEGDSIKVVDNKLYVNNGIFVFPFPNESQCENTSLNIQPVIINNESVFVVGDNICNSIDSRQFGAVRSSALLGKPVAIYFSMTPGQGASEADMARVGTVLR